MPLHSEESILAPPSRQLSCAGCALDGPSWVLRRPARSSHRDSLSSAKPLHRRQNEAAGRGPGCLLSLWLLAYRRPRHADDAAAARWVTTSRPSWRQTAWGARLSLSSPARPCPASSISTWRPRERGQFGYLGQGVHPSAKQILSGRTCKSASTAAGRECSSTARPWPQRQASQPSRRWSFASFGPRRSSTSKPWGPCFLMQCTMRDALASRLMLCGRTNPKLSARPLELAINSSRLPAGCCRIASC